MVIFGLKMKMIMKKIFFNISLLTCIVCVNTMCGQETKLENFSDDTLKAAKIQKIIKELHEQQNLDLQLDDTLHKTKDNEILQNDFNQKLKFIILCFNLSKSYYEEIIALNKIAKEYKNNVSSLVIEAGELKKYNEVFTRKEFKSLQEFILNKSEVQKRATSFPVILILDKNGQILNAWSGDKNEDGLKSDDYYTKIKTGLENISKQK